MDGLSYLQAVLALSFVLALIGALALVARRMGLGYAVPRRQGQNRRLAVVEVMPLDPKRRLVLVRRDGREHLLLLGLGGETVVESRDAEGTAGGDFSAALAAVEDKP
ncbi:MAG: FliO/MopB family protein [Rhodobacterales bacterium]|nr:FliO/MopB family protein [Rhodobacterales bacterium]